MANHHLIIAPEVADALKNNKAVIALESTIISHGMPYPKNVETALQVEKIIRDNGAVPATIAIIDGKLKAGLSESEIELLGKLGTKAIKTSRRDLSFMIAKKAIPEYIILYDISGRIVLKQTMGQTTVQLETGNLKGGIYTLTALLKDGRKVSELVVIIH